MDASWDGTTRAETVTELAAAIRQHLADCAKRSAWDEVFEVLAEQPTFVNSTRPDGTSWYAPLHQAAHAGAPLVIVDRLLAAGAWRSLRTARGERAVDIAGRLGHTHLLDRLQPERRMDVPTDVLEQIQGHFHGVIRGRAHQLVDNERLRLPELEILLELSEPKMWFPVPGMYGGFSYWLEVEHAQVQLVTESWSRVVGGSAAINP